MKTIGINGRKGSGKTTWSYLLANTLEWLEDNPGMYTEKLLPLEYVCKFEEWIGIIKSRNNFIREANTKNVYLASFSDNLKYMVSILTGIDFNILSEVNNRKDTFINIRTYEVSYNINKEDIITAKELFDLRSTSLSDSYADTKRIPLKWMEIREYIIYFGYYMCRNYLGKNIWLNVLKNDNNKFDFTDTKYRIYTDVRTTAECEYIRENNGVLIRLNRENNLQYDKLFSDISIDNDVFDISIDISEGLNNLCPIIWKLSLTLQSSEYNLFLKKDR